MQCVFLSLNPRPTPNYWKSRALDLSFQQHTIELTENKKTISQKVREYTGNHPHVLEYLSKISIYHFVTTFKRELSVGTQRSKQVLRFGTSVSLTLRRSCTLRSGTLNLSASEASILWHETFSSTFAVTPVLAITFTPLPARRVIWCLAVVSVTYKRCLRRCGK